MSFKIITAAEAASHVKHGYNVGLGGFTPAGTPKTVTAEIARIAEAEHAADGPFQIGLFTGLPATLAMVRSLVPRHCVTVLPILLTAISVRLSMPVRLPTTTFTSHRWHRRCATASWAKLM